MRLSKVLMGSQRCHNPFCGLSVSERVNSFRHLRVCGGVIQQAHRFTEDDISLGSDELQSACRDSLRALSHVTHNEHRYPESRRFLLNATRISQDDRKIIRLT